ncbi:MAG: carboxypeptidase regulatory-like domain-containing protein [Bryobacteraceae bacterium]
MAPSRSSIVLALLLAVSFLALDSKAQETRATLSGTISDQSGAAVSDATLRLVNVDTSVEATTQSNQLGQYHFLFVNPGNYRLTAEMSGFRKYVREGIQLETNQSATLDVSLQLGNQAETVTVASEAPLLEAEKADRGAVIETKALAELPTITRTPILLATLAPGVVATNPRYDLTPFSNSGLTTWSINGSTSLSTEFLLDGSPNTVVYQSQPSIAFVPPNDAVRELKVIANAYDSQYGHNGGGVISIVTNSGTNQIHGSAYEFLKRPWLNANSFANNSKGITARDYNTLDQYGFSFGAPVWIPKVYKGKDRTFFFTSWESYQQNIVFPTNDISSVPTAAQRAGDFSQTFSATGQLMPIYDPASGHAVGSNWVRDPFPGNKIPTNRINPVGQSIANLYPLPNTTTAGSVPWQNNFFYQNNVTWYDFHNFVTRVDHNFGEKERIYGRYLWNSQTLHQNSNGLPGYGADLREGVKGNNGFLFDSLTVLSANTTFDMRASILRWVQDYKPYNWGSYNASVIGFPQSLIDQLQEPNRFPSFTINSYKNLGPSSGNIWYTGNTTIALQPTLSTIQGRHSLRFGLDFRWNRYANYQSVGSGSLFSVDRGFTRSNYLTQDALSGNAIASLLLGTAASGEADYVASPYYSFKYYAPFIQDDIKVSRRLTVNAGVRWDINAPVKEKYNRANYGFLSNQVNPISNGINQALFPGYKVYGGIGFVGQGGLPDSPFKTDWNNWQPRIGAAFQLTPKTVLRGGYGISYINTVSTGTTLGFSQSTAFVSSLDAGRTPAALLSNPFPSGVMRPSGSSAGLATSLGQNLTYSDPTGAYGYVHTFSFGIQQQFPAQIVVEASYVGSRTLDVPTTHGVNELSAASLALGDVTRGGNPTFLTGQVPNPFYSLLAGTSYNGTTIPRQQLLRPFPEFGTIAIQDQPTGRFWYNSLQIKFEKRYSRGLLVNGAYTLSKNMQGVTYLNPQDPAPSRSLVPWDQPQRLVFAAVYELPFGPGRKFVNNSNGLLSRVVGGWQLATNTTFRSGAPMTVPPGTTTIGLTSSGGVAVLGDPRLDNPTWDRMFKTGLIDATGAVRNVGPGEQPVFQILPAFALRTASQYFGNLRNRWGPEFNVTLAKNTTIRENYLIQLRVEAFNLFNHPIFGGDPVIDPTNANFGALLRNNGQSNIPRQLQLGVRLSF